MSDFKFSCPQCQQNIQATPEYSGMQINCPACQTLIVVPQAPAAAPSAAAPKAGKLSKAPSTVEPVVTTPAMATTIVRKAKKPRIGLYVGLGVGVAVAVAAVVFVPQAIDKYHEHKEAQAAAEAAAKAPPPPPPDLTAEEILKKVDETYKGFTSYSAQAASAGTFDMSQINPKLKTQKMKARLSILLGRPDHYRFEWEKEAKPKSIKGAVWSAGKGDYVKTGPTATKVKNRDLALAAAGANSGTLGVGLAGLFFESTNSLALVMKNYEKQPNETLGGHKCYVLSGEASSQNFVLWIHKDDFLIAQAKLVLGGKVDDAALAGLSAVKKAQAQMMMKMKGNITETYEDIQINKELAADAFQTDFAPTAALNRKESKPGGKKERQKREGAGAGLQP